MLKHDDDDDGSGGDDDGAEGGGDNVFFHSIFTVDLNILPLQCLQVLAHCRSVERGAGRQAGVW